MLGATRGTVVQLRSCSTNIPWHGGECRAALHPGRREGDSDSLHYVFPLGTCSWDWVSEVCCHQAIHDSHNHTMPAPPIPVPAQLTLLHLCKVASSTFTVGPSIDTTLVFSWARSAPSPACSASAHPPLAPTAPPEMHQVKVQLFNKAAAAPTHHTVLIQSTSRFSHGLKQALLYGQHERGQPACFTAAAKEGSSPHKQSGQGGAGAPRICRGSPASPSIALGALMFGKSKLLWDAIKDKFK